MRRSILGLAALAIPFIVGHAPAQTWTVISEALAGDVQIIDPFGLLLCEYVADILLSKEYMSPCGFHHEGLRRARLALPGGVEYTVAVDFDLHTYDYWNGDEFDVFYLNAGTSTFSPSSITSLGATTCGQTYSGVGIPGVPGQTWWWGGNQDCPSSVCSIFGSFVFDTGSLDPGVTTYLEVGLKTGFLVNSWGKFTISVAQRRTETTIRYRTFIHCEVLETDPVPWLFDYFTGDDRWFSPTAGTARSDQSTKVSVDILYPTGQVAPSTQFFGPTLGYDTAVSCLACQGFAVLPPDYCNWCVDPTALPGCSATAVAGQDGNVLRMFHSRVNPTEVKVDVKLVGYNPCSIPGAPAIDTIFTIRFRQSCEDGLLAPMEFKIDPGGMHDGFPWHELYLNNQRIYKHDPCSAGSSPLALFGDLEIAINNPPQLLQWQTVPGQ